ncbi:MAG: exodeoxyribonuclease III [Verrucomicrobiota bacterium]
MKIATFNANSIRARMPVASKWIKDNRPDILCIQETKTHDAFFPQNEFTKLGYHVSFRGEKGYNGVAIASLKQPDQIKFGFHDGKESREDTRLAYGKFGPLHIVNTYVPQGRDINNPAYKYKLDWFQRLRNLFETEFTTRQKVLWTGDFNIAPTFIDVHNPERQSNHVCYHQNARQAFQDTVSWGFIDVFRKSHPEPGHYSFFDYRTKNAVERSMGWRVDHFLATKPLANTSTDCYIDVEPRKWDKPSDHTFVVAEFDL